MSTKLLSGTVCMPKSHFQDDLWLAEGFSIGQAWMDLWGLANDRRRVLKIRGVDVTVERGQLAYALQTLGDRWHCTRDKVRKILAELMDARKITVQSSNVTTIITVIEYKSWNADTSPELPLDLTPESPADQSAESTPNHTPESPADQSAESTQKYGSKEVGKMEEGNGERKPPESFVPDNDEVSAFCRAWAGDLSRGIPGGIPDVWWMGWLADRLNSDRPFPRNWKRVLELKFVSDWVGGHPKARGGMLSEKNSPAPPLFQTNGRPAGWLEGDQAWWWSESISAVEGALRGALIGGDSSAARIREVIQERTRK